MNYTAIPFKFILFDVADSGHCQRIKKQKQKNKNDFLRLVPFGVYLSKHFEYSAYMYALSVCLNIAGR